MSYEKVIFGRLTNNAAVAALVGKRVRPFKAAQRDANPKIAYHQTSCEETYSNDGDSNLSIVQCQLDVYADTPEGLFELVAAIKVASSAGGPLSGYRGSTNTGGITVQALFIRNDADVEEGVIDGTDTAICRHMFDLEIWLDK